MEFARINKESLINAYSVEQKSITEIAEQYKTNPTKVRRALLFLGVAIRSYSEAQKLSLSSGRAKHPTKGEKRSKVTLQRMSESLSKAWKDLPEEKKEALKAIRRENWAAMSIEERKNIQELAHKAIRQSAEIGSKTERYVVGKLEELGYGVIVHARNLIQSTSLEVDMFLPSLRTAIEIDGPSHFSPIWGADKLVKQQASDAAKQGLLLNSGYVILRIRQYDKSMSAKRMNDTLALIVDELKKIEENFPEEGHRLIEIQVKDGICQKI